MRDKNNYILTERSYLFEPNVYCTMVVELEGEIDKQELGSAIKRTYAQNEVTMSKLVLEDDGTAYYEKMEETGCKVYVDQRDWQTIKKESQRDTFKINEGELVRTYIIPRGKEMTLLIMWHHIIGDGKASLFFLEDILNHLDGKEVEYKHMHLIDKKTISKKRALSLLFKMVLRMVNRKWKKEGKAFTWEDYFYVHKKYWESVDLDVDIKTIDKTELQEMKANSKKMGVTLNSYLVGKILKENLDSKEVTIPVSVREQSREMANFVTSVQMQHQYDSEKTFEENVQEIHKKITAEIKDTKKLYYVIAFVAALAPTLYDSVLMHVHAGYQNQLTEIMAGRMRYTEQELGDMMITNLVKLDMPREYAKFKVSHILAIPPKLSYIRNMIGIGTYEDKLSISYQNLKKVTN